MKLEFHQKTFDYLGEDPVLLASAAAKLDAREKRCGAPIPRSVREWYSIEGALRLMRGPDSPVPLARLGARFDDEEPSLVEQGLLWFLSENQGVCRWAARLGAAADPEVVVAVDDDEEWLPCADAFSTFVLCRVWDTRPRGGSRIGCRLSAQVEALADDELAVLRRSFREAPSTRSWPSDHQYRFFSDAGSILIWAGDRGTDWFFRAESWEGLRDLLRPVWNRGQLRSALYGLGERGERALARIRAELDAAR